MVLNNEFWEALSGNQRRLFAKANCEATYKKAIIFQILATFLGMLGIGLFLPIANKANSYWKGYYSLREVQMPISVKIMCGINFVLGLVANIVFIVMGQTDDYGMFVNTLTRRELESMLQEPAPVATVGANSDDPFRISNIAPPKAAKVTRPIRKGCENFPEWLLLIINIAIIIVFIIIYSLLLPSAKSNNNNNDNGKTPSSSTIDTSSAVVSSIPEQNQFGDITRMPTDWSKNISMQINSNTGLRLRKGPSSRDEIITTMSDKSVVTVMNNSDVTDWCFVSYKKGSKVYYGWACAKMGEDQYLIETTSSSTQSETSSTDSSKLLTTQQLKELSAAHIQAILDVENGFVGYVTCNNKDTDNAIYFGDDNTKERYFLATNVKNMSDFNSYLSKYMLPAQANNVIQKSDFIATAEDTTSVPDKPIVLYNGAIYVAASAGSNYTLDQGTFSVLSSSEESYIVTVSAKDDEDNPKKFTINFQYIDQKLAVTSYK